MVTEETCKSDILQMIYLFILPVIQRSGEKFFGKEKILYEQSEKWKKIVQEHIHVWYY